MAALEAERNEQRRTITWSFTAYDARQKLRRLYPIPQPPTSTDDQATDLEQSEGTPS